MTIKICWNKLCIGEQRAAGKTLEKSVFLSLRKVERLRAYLLMAWPGSRSVAVLAQACQVPKKDIANYLKTDLRDGVIFQPARGQWQARPREVQP